LADSFANKRINDFWSEIKKIRRCTSSTPNSVDNESGSENIANMFARKYGDLYNSVPSHDRELNDLSNEISDLIEARYGSPVDHRDIRDLYFIKPAQVINAISKLKSGRSDGSSGLTSDYFIHGSENLYSHLSFLLSLMVTHGYAPRNYGKTSIVPIPKDTRKSLHNSTNYRGIALSSILAKILDWIFINNNVHGFQTCDLQFGFKIGHSTQQCTFAVNEVIHYYNQRNTGVFTTLLDASKAFDKVHFVTLFRLLIKKNICPLTIRFLLKSYINQTMQVKWNNSYSHTFSVKNGVKQGGVLSPILFAVYIEDLFSHLAASGFGCYIGRKFVGAFSYADDIVLLCPSKYAMQKLLSICSKFSNSHKITFNPDKTKLMYSSFENDSITVDHIRITFEGKTLNMSKTEKHLGNLIGFNANRLNILNCIYDLNRRVNSLVYHFHNSHPKVIYFLFKTYCMSLYGSVLWDYANRHSNLIYTAWRKAIRKIFNLPYRTHSRLLSDICNDSPIDVQLHNRVVKFIHGASSNGNETLNLLVRLVLYGNTSPVGNSINVICHKYNISRINWPSSLNQYTVNADPSWISQSIKEFMSLRYEQKSLNSNQAISLDEINAILDYLCTD